ncbi:MAG: hypothetical protein J6S11_02220 [Bacteroidaceae bacterium]|nr:hypothetical protein [Bacteroidaceae bacterium]
MIKTRYCVLWMPCTIHSKLFLREIANPQELHDCSDEEEKSIEDKLVIKISNNSTNFHIKVENGKGEDTDFSFDLELIDCSRNGLFLYKYEHNDESPLFHEGKFPPVIYHKIKEYYHEHENNNKKNADGNLMPFDSDDIVNIKEDNNSALLWYLEQYERVFITYHENIKTFYEDFHEKIARRRSYYINSTPAIKIIDDLYFNAIGEMTYYNCLYNSVYNQNFTLGNREEDERNRSLRQKVFNIQNTITRIEWIRNKANAIYQQRVTDKSLKLAIWGVIAGIVGVLVGFASFIFF